MNKKALILVDIQKDFCPGGSYPVPNGDEIISSVNKMISFAKNNGWLIIASRDWHPKETGNIKSWTAHCIENTDGAKFHPGLSLDNSIPVISKGKDLSDKHYSAFNGDNISLKEKLEEGGVEEVFIVGLATDYCVKNTAIDAVKNGFKTTVILDATRGIYKRKTKEEIIEELQKAGVVISSTENVVI